MTKTFFPQFYDIKREIDKDVSILDLEHLDLEFVYVSHRVFDTRRDLVFRI